jgi:hypothetical protein
MRTASGVPLMITSAEAERSVDIARTSVVAASKPLRRQILGKAPTSDFASTEQFER